MNNLINLFLQRLGDLEKRPLRVLGDDLVEQDGQQIALVHTSVAGVQHDEQDGQRLQEYLQPLEVTLKPFCKGPTSISVPIRALESGNDWDSIAESIEYDLKKRLPKMKAGTLTLTIPETHFKTTITIRPQGDPDVSFSRGIDLESLEGKQELRRALEKKNRELSRYGIIKTQTWLLVESSPIARADVLAYQDFLNEEMARGLVVDSIQRIFFADTTLPQVTFRELKLTPRTFIPPKRRAPGRHRKV